MMFVINKQPVVSNSVRIRIHIQIAASQDVDEASQLLFWCCMRRITFELTSSMLLFAVDGPSMQFVRCICAYLFHSNLAKDEAAF